jgi:hydroxymethylpyrimidine pyrophosphatase-like HAD family hydrolase
MRYPVLASDYDGTLAHDGRVDTSTRVALHRLQASGRKLILVTGRELNELVQVFPDVGLCALVVAENGALLYHPRDKTETVLAPPPSPGFVQALKQRGVAPLSVGRVIVAAWRPHETTILEVIREQGLQLQVIYNKDAVMVLPTGVNKATGLRAALTELGHTPEQTVGVGDAENDHAMLTLCGFSVAVANALPLLKSEVDYVTRGDHGTGVTELIDELIRSDLAQMVERSPRHQRVAEKAEHVPEIR